MGTQKERIVLITGGSSGIGFAMAKQMVAQQATEATVIVCGRSQEKLDGVKRKVPQLVTIQCDLTRQEDRNALCDKIAREFNGLNMLINNAGIVQRYDLAKPGDIEDRIVAEWQTNFMAPVLLCNRLMPILARNKGAIVNVTSGLVHIPLSIQPNYCATKAALHSMTQSMRVALSKQGVKVVEIFYPAVDTPFQEGRAPVTAITADEAAAIALKELSKGKDEIHVKMAAFLFLLSRLMPKRALYLFNKLFTEKGAEKRNSG